MGTGFPALSGSLLVLDAVAAAGDGAAAFACCVDRLLRAAYTGPLIRVRKGTSQTNNSGEQDFYPNASGELDVATIASYCGAMGGYIAKVYDQSGNGRDFFTTSTTYQLMIYHPTLGQITHVGGAPAMYQDGFRALEQTAHGLSGATAVTLAFDANRDREILSAHGSLAVAYLSGASHFSSRLCWYPQARAGAGGVRSKQYDVYTSDSCGYIYTLAAGATLANVNIYQNGALLAAKPVQYGPTDANTTTTINLSGGAFWTATDALASGTLRGRYSHMIAWPAVLSTAGRAAVSLFQSEIYASGAQSFSGSPLVVMAGQSNGELFSYTPSLTNYPFDVRIDGRYWTQAAFSGSSIAQWQQGVQTESLMSCFDEAVALAQRADANEHLAFLWIQGEADCGDVLSPDYADGLAQLVADLETVLGREFLWIDVLLGTGISTGTPAGIATVNAAKVALAASRGVHGATIDVDTLAGGYDGSNVHYNQARMNAVYDAAKVILDAYSP